jgi:hypothetical protein
MNNTKSAMEARRYTKKESMRIFDSLPPRARAAVREAVTNILPNEDLAAALRNGLVSEDAFIEELAAYNQRDIEAFGEDHWGGYSPHQIASATVQPA